MSIFVFCISSVQAQSPIPPPRNVVLPLQAEDIRLQIDAQQSFSSYRWLWSAECAGQTQGALNIPEAGLHGSDLGNGQGTLRFGKVLDPADPTRMVLMFRATYTDPFIYGGPRCEMTFSPSFSGKIPVNQDIWVALGIRLHDWIPGADEQIILQWHWSNGSISIGPFLALTLKHGQWGLDTKSNMAYPPAASTTTSMVHWSAPAIANQWTYFVIKARISPHNTDKPYLYVWRDGMQIVNYSGPLGYNYPEVTPYMKLGHYHWITSYNPWSENQPVKTVLIRHPILAVDPNARYREVDLRMHVNPLH